MKWRRASILMLAIVGGFVFVGTVHAAGLNEGLVAYYPFNGNANDASGNGHHGAVHGAGLIQDRFGYAASAYHFDGIDDYIEVADDGSFNVGPYLTVSLWIRFPTDDAPGRTVSFVSKSAWPAEINTGYIFPYLHDGYSFGLIVYTEYGWIFDQSLSYNDIDSPTSWHLYTATYDGSYRRVYIDAVLVASDPQSGIITSNGNSLVIGNQPGTNEWANASMDDIRIYNRVLSQEEIEELYGDPTSVELMYFRAIAGDGSVMVKWETASEIDNAGFHLWRSKKKDGRYARITDEIIPAEGGAAMGAFYFFEDTHLAVGKKYFYKLEDIDVGGASAFHGPVKTRMGKKTQK